jgi:hypothetical protein
MQPIPTFLCAGHAGAGNPRTCRAASALTIAPSLYLKIEIQRGGALASRNPQRNGRCGNRRASR